MGETWQQLATNVRANLAITLGRLTEANNGLIRAQGTVKDRAATPQEAAEIRAFIARKTELEETAEDLEYQAKEFERQARMEDLDRRDSKARGGDGQVERFTVGAEPETYTAHTARAGVSFFRDMYTLSLGHDAHAFARQQRYAEERDVARERADGQFVTRAGSTSSFGGLVPPNYLVEDAALVARAGRPIANACRRLPLEAEGMSLIIPRGTTGASAAVQATENSPVSSTDEAWGNLTIPVISIAGQQDVSRQTLERGTPGIDSIIFQDLAAAYGVALDQQVISGTGSSGQALGILNTAGIGQSTAFTAAAVAASFLTKSAGAIASIQTNRKLAPDVIFMHPNRWAWLTQLLDSQGHPVVVANSAGPMNALASFTAPVDSSAGTPAGTLLGLPVITDSNLPTAVGSGPEDVLVFARRADLMLWENSDGSPTDLRFEQTLGNQLTVKLVAYGYSAFTAGRYPGAIAVVGGNSALGFGLVAPTF